LSLKVQNLSHTYAANGLEPRTVLQPLPCWELPSGTQVLLRGISGSGKTTLLNILAGLMRPTTGDVNIAGRWLYQMDEAQRDVYRRQHIGYVFQMHHLVPALNTVDNVMMPMAFAGMPPKLRRARALDLLAQVGLSEFIDHQPNQLSVGQRLRVTIARALVHSPTVILADEPTAALDSEAATGVMDLLQASCRDHNAILLVASHDPALNDRFDQTYNLVAGRLFPSGGQPFVQQEIKTDVIYA
jgi:ABC-type lipoprotein export system ATPase subunit